MSLLRFISACRIVNFKKDFEISWPFLIKILQELNNEQYKTYHYKKRERSFWERETIEQFLQWLPSWSPFSVKKV